MTNQQIGVAVRFYGMVKSGLNPWSTRSQDEIMLIQSLAEEFSHTLERWNGELNMKKVIGLNKKESDSRVCHSHDFCDANMAMEEAFVEVFGEEMVGEDEDYSHAQYQMSIWNEAWDIAQINNFYLKA